MVRTAIVFMDEPSRCAASASALLAFATSMLILESSWVKKANSWSELVSRGIARALELCILLQTTDFAPGPGGIRIASLHLRPVCAVPSLRREC